MNEISNQINNNNNQQKPKKHVKKGSMNGNGDRIISGLLMEEEEAQDNQ